MSCAMVKRTGVLMAAATRLAQIHLARDDDAVHGGGDFAVAEIGLGALERRLLDGDRGFGLRQFGDGLIQVQLRGGFQRDENFLSLQILALERDISLRAGQLALGLAQGGFIDGRVNFRNELAFFHRRVEVGIQRCDFSGNLAADVHADHGAERAARRNMLYDVAA